MATADATIDRPRSLEISSRLTVGKASLLMAAMIALSRITGYGRQVLTSYLYGISGATDACNAAFNIPDTITIIIAGGALATGFVPVFTEYLARGQQEAARRTFRAMFTLLGCAFGAITLVLLLLTFTPWGTLLAPKKVDAQYIDLYLYILRILLISQFFFIVGGLFSGTLNALRLFIYPALQPVMFNCGIIIFGIALPHYLHMGIESQAWGAMIGSVVGSLLIQMPAVVRSGLSLRPLWDMQDEGVRRVLRSLAPIVFGLASGQIIALNLPRFFAVGLPEGNLTALDNANRLMQVPLAMLASGPAIALYPTLSLLSAKGDRVEMRRQISHAYRRTLQLTILASALMMALGFPLIHLLLEHGSFGKAQTKNTATILWYYSFCLVGLGAQQILARGFYALQDTATPVVIGVITMVIFMGLGAGAAYGTAMGAAGLALAAAIAVSLLAFWMWVSLSAQLDGWDAGASVAVAWRALIGGVVAYYAAWFVAHYGIILIGAQGLDGPRTPGLLKLAARAAVAGAGAVVGAGGYLVVTRALGMARVGGSLGGAMKRDRSAVLSEPPPSSATPTTRAIAPIMPAADAATSSPVANRLAAIRARHAATAVSDHTNAVPTREPASNEEPRAREIPMPASATPPPAAPSPRQEPPADALRGTPPGNAPGGTPPGNVRGGTPPANAPRDAAKDKQRSKPPRPLRGARGRDGASTDRWLLGGKKISRHLWPRRGRRMFGQFDPSEGQDDNGR